MHIVASRGGYSRVSRYRPRCCIDSISVEIIQICATTETTRRSDIVINSWSIYIIGRTRISSVTRHYIRGVTPGEGYDGDDERGQEDSHGGMKRVGKHLTKCPPCRSRAWPTTRLCFGIPRRPNMIAPSDDSHVTVSKDSGESPNSRASYPCLESRPGWPRRD